MNLRILCVMATLCMAASGCHDRTNPGEQQPRPAGTTATPGSPAGTSPGNAAGVDRGQQQAPASQPGNIAANGHGTKPSFEELDVTHRGFLTEADVAADPLVAQRFKACDADADGHLTKAEFDACKPAP